MSRSVAHSISPRKWQVEALAAWIGNDHKGIVEVVTGGGKTKFALLSALAWLETSPTGLVQVIVPTLSLQDQWLVALEADLGLGVNEVALDPARVGPSTRFVVVVINTARARPSLSDRPMMLIADECHRYASPQNSAALRRPWSATLGLSATAEREYDDGLSETLVPTLGPIVFRYSLRTGLEDGVVNGYRALNVAIDLTTDESMEFDAISRRLGAAIAQDHGDTAKRLAMQRARLVNRAEWRVPAALALIDRFRGRRIMAFCEEITQAEQLANSLLRRKHSAGVYHSGLGPELRRDNLRLFRRGINDVIVACRALDEGVDIPEADMAVIVSSTATRRQRIQRIGRALRTSPGKAEAIVVTIYATSGEQSRLFVEQDILEGVVETSWERIRLA